ncbi:ATP-dependent helicase, partial [Rhodovulum sulfidophilum]|nr:ATP-dependent helicase [Rhodovulum sulfidophilum]
VHQILSVIAQRGGASANVIYNVLCREGPFRKVTTEVFANVLRAIGHPETGLIEQSGSGLLLLGKTGERLVEHYSFYAVFQTPEEFRLVADGRDLGTLPVDNVLAPGMLLIFSGRRWVVQEIHDLEKVIVVKPAKAGVPPVFGGDPGDIHDKVIGQMFAVLEGDFKPVYMDAVAHAILEEARAHYDQLEFKANNIRSLGERTWIIATRFGTVKTSTLALALRSEGLLVEQHDGFLVVEAGDETPDLQMVLARFSAGYTGDVFAGAENLITEKFHVYLSRSLLELDAVSSRLVPDLLPGMASRILQL